MNVLVVPMFALSRMGGPWSRAQAVAAAFRRAGHRVALGVADDGNCLNPCVDDTLQLPVPSPLGLPMAVASRTFPLAEKLGISGRKPVRSFEEVLWLTGALSYDYLRESVGVIVDTLADERVDAVYSEYSLPAIVAARAAGVPVFGSFSYTTQMAYASEPAKAAGVRKLLDELGLPAVESSLELFDWLERRFVPSCHALEPLDDADVEFVGFMKRMPAVGTGAESAVGDVERDCIVVYLGSGSVPQGVVKKAVMSTFAAADVQVYVAGARDERTVGNVHFAPRHDFSALLPHARCFVHHGGQNSTMDAFAYAVPQVIVPGRVFERLYNAQSVQRAGAGIVIERLDADNLADAVRRAGEGASFRLAAAALHEELASLGGAETIVHQVEERI